MKTYIFDFHEKLYISEIKNLAFHLPHICIIFTQNYVKESREAFKFRG